MSLTIDVAAATRQVSDDELRRWASSHTVFLSSVMGELAAERRALVAALQEAGFSVRWFEELGGRDEDAQRAYLAEVAAADIYVGLLGGDYGAMLPDGFSATHSEFLEARRRGKRISFWARDSQSDRSGHARNFLAEVRVFHVTGSFAGADDLPVRVLRRLTEMAADDIAPWVKLGELVIRAERIRDSGRELTLACRVRDGQLQQALDQLDPSRSWGHGEELAVTYSNRSGVGRVEGVEIDMRSAVTRDVTVRLAVDWSSGGETMAAGTTGLSPEDLVEVGVRAGLLHEQLPERLGGLTFMVDATDPLVPLHGASVPEDSLQSIARLLLVERLVGAGKAASVDEFVLGPQAGGQRHLRVGWWEPRRYSNVEPRHRVVEGVRAWAG